MKTCRLLLQFNAFRSARLTAHRYGFSVNAYEEYLADPAFAEKFRRSYTGRFPTDAALWWADHPDSPTPAGVPSPYEDLGHLRRAAFARGAAPDQIARLRGLEKQVDADTAETLAAIEIARAPTLDTERHSTPADVEALSSLDGASAALPSKRWKRSVATAIGSVAILSLFVGAIIGWTWSNDERSNPQKNTEASHISALASRTASPALNYNVGNFTERLDAKQTAEDVPKAGLGNFIAAKSVRVIWNFPKGQSDVSQAVYAAKNRAGSPCLILIIGARHEASASCASESDVARSGLSVWLQTGNQYYTAELKSDGSIAGDNGNLSN